MTTHPFHNHATQAERKVIVSSERNTYLSRTESDEETGGRFKKETPTVVIAKNAAAQYPFLPASSPWSAPCPSGAEPPLCIDVNDLGFDRSALGADVAPASGSPPAAVEIETPASIFSNKLRRI